MLLCWNFTLKHHKYKYNGAENHLFYDLYDDFIDTQYFHQSYYNNQLATYFHNFKNIIKILMETV